MMITFPRLEELINYDDHLPPTRRHALAVQRARGRADLAAVRPLAQAARPSRVALAGGGTAPVSVAPAILGRWAPE